MSANTFKIKRTLILARQLAQGAEIIRNGYQPSPAFTKQSAQDYLRTHLPAFIANRSFPRICSKKAMERAGISEEDLKSRFFTWPRKIATYTAEVATWIEANTSYHIDLANMLHFLHTNTQIIPQMGWIKENYAAAESAYWYASRKLNIERKTAEGFRKAYGGDYTSEAHSQINKLRHNFFRLISQNLALIARFDQQPLLAITSAFKVKDPVPTDALQIAKKALAEDMLTAFLETKKMRF